MDRIQKVSVYILCILNILLITVPLFSLIQWIFISTKISDVSDVINFFGIFERVIQTPEGYVNLSNAACRPLSQLLGFVADLVDILPFLISLFILKAIFKNYQKGEIFSLSNATQCRKLGALLLLDALFIKSFAQTLMVLAITSTNLPGHRYFSISFGTPNLTALFYGILVIIVSWIMLEASRLHDEQQFTI